MTQIVACKHADLDDGGIVEVTAGPASIVVVRCAEQIYAIDNYCPHRGAPLSDGRVSVPREEIICPWHGFRFALATGKSVTNPEVGVRTFPVRVVDGDVVVDLTPETAS